MAGKGQGWGVKTRTRYASVDLSSWGNGDGYLLLRKDLSYLRALFTQNPGPDLHDKELAPGDYLFGISQTSHCWSPLSVVPVRIHGAVLARPPLPTWISTRSLQTMWICFLIAGLHTPLTLPTPSQRENQIPSSFPSHCC